MARVPDKRPRRNPLTSEEVTHIIAHNKKKELVTLLRFKKSWFFKVLNIFNIACIFLYIEILFCYVGPCHYQKHFLVKTAAHNRSQPMQKGVSFISDIDIYDVNGRSYKFVINDYVDPPATHSWFIIGKDFLLQKELKGAFEGSEKVFRLFSASPVLILCILACFFSFFGFVMNLNENVYTLGGLSTLNFLCLLAVTMI